MYIYSKNKKAIESILRNTQSGGVCINECLLHQAEYAVPFGGVGHSGMGSYHGEKSFATFTHERSILYKQQNMEGTNTSVKYPPYSDRKFKLMRLVMIGHPLLTKLKAYRTPLKVLVFILLLTLYFKK